MEEGAGKMGPRPEHPIWMKRGEGDEGGRYGKGTHPPSPSQGEGRGGGTRKGVESPVEGSGTELEIDTVNEGTVNERLARRRVGIESGGWMKTESK